MYNEKFLQSILNQLKLIFVIISVIFFLSLLTSIFSAVIFTNMVGMIILVAGVCICIFVWGMYGTKIFAYYNFIKEILYGRTRELCGNVISVSDTPVYKDNKLYYYEIIVGDEEGEERLLLYDSNLSFFNFQENHSYKFLIHENFIVDVINQCQL